MTQNALCLRALSRGVWGSNPIRSIGKNRRPPFLMRADMDIEQNSGGISL